MDKIRYVAQVVFQAETPLKVGSGDGDLFQDAPVFKDFNSLPMILGSSIAGVLRRYYNDTDANKIFGYQEEREKEGEGSRLIVSNALLLDENGKVNEKLLIENNSTFLEGYDNLPVRNHVKITAQGVSDNANYAKFDEEIVFKGSRFKCELELIGDESYKGEWDNLLKLLTSETFRLGGGSTKGFGKLSVVSCKKREFDFSNLCHLKEYQAKSSKLDCPTWDNIPDIRDELTSNRSGNHIKYILKLEPDDFFMFGSGIADTDADMTPVKEKIITWTNGIGTFENEQILIPASSIKGALSHRTAFYYNKLQGATIENGQGEVGEKNEAVKLIFGEKKDKEVGQKGKILIGDCFKPDQNETKVFDHVKIDRFTGGAMDGALFQEKTIAQKDNWEIEILLENIDDQEIVCAFENALKDIVKGMLPLGGSVNRGHGIFTGYIIKDGSICIKETE